MNRCMGMVVLALTAMLGIAGCAGTNVGGSWQCPLAQGEVCTSVSAADPAVPLKAEGLPPAGEVPLYRPRVEGGETARSTRTSPATEAGKECRKCGMFPFGWLARLFSSTSHAGDLSVSGVAGPEDPAEPSADAAAADLSMSRSSDEVPDDAEKKGTRVTRKVVPEDAREPETIGRVWIGPFVDADGVYREASWVRIVISPASWRLP